MGMPYKRDVSGPRGKHVRSGITISEVEYARVLELATSAGTRETAIIATALSLGLSVLEGPSGREILEGMSMMRFLRGEP